MSFNRYRDSIIEDFKESCKEAFKSEVSDENVQEIKERFEEHRQCYEHKHEFDEENLDIMSTVVYGDMNNVSIECFNCNSIIIDSEALELGDE